MPNKQLRIFKIYFSDPINNAADRFFIPAYTSDDAVRFAEEGGIKVEFVQECYFHEGFIIC